MAYRVHRVTALFLFPRLCTRIGPGGCRQDSSLDLFHSLLYRRRVGCRVCKDGRFCVGDKVEFGHLQSQRQQSSTIIKMTVKVAYLEGCIQSNDGRRLETQAQAVCQREPIPELREECHAHNRIHMRCTGLALHRNGDIPSPGINDTLGNSRTKLGERVLVLVCDDGLQRFSNRIHLGRLRLVLLDADHGESDKGALTNKVDRVLHHGFEQINGFLEEGRRE